MFYSHLSSVHGRLSRADAPVARQSRLLTQALYPGLSEVLQHQQRLEAELSRLESTWDEVARHRSDLESRGQQTAAQAQDVIWRLDRLQAGLSLIKAR